MPNMTKNNPVSRMGMANMNTRPTMLRADWSISLRVISSSFTT